MVLSIDLGMLYKVATSVFFFATSISLRILSLSLNDRAEHDFDMMETQDGPDGKVKRLLSLSISD